MKKKENNSYLILIVLLILLEACGSATIRGRPPQISLDEIVVNGANVSLDLRVRNINQVPMDVRSLNYTLATEGEQLFAYSADQSLFIGPSGTEVGRTQVSADEQAVMQITALEGNRQLSLPYLLSGHLQDAEGKRHPFQVSGHLFSVPGKPGHFH